MKKAFILLTVLALAVGAFSCGGGGAGGLNSPGGENPGIASIVQLNPVHYISQTNGFITFRAKVLDGNGAPIPNTRVDFTNQSSVGTFQAASLQTSAAAAYAYTDGSGLASIRVFSTTSGFVTVIAQVYTGSGNVRDQKTVYFTNDDVLAVSMALDVDADNDLIYDEASDILIGETATDTSVKVRARVYNAGGVLLAGRTVTFDSERAYRTGTSIIGTDTSWACSDGSSTCWVAFPLGRTMYTNEAGAAFAQVVVATESLRNFTSNLNIFATADNGASNMKTLFISPVTVSSITIVANPAVIPPSISGTPSTSTITATALTNFNQYVPDGTAVNFTIDAACSAAGGKITPFGRTTDGAATATFTAPSALMTCTITASIGSVSATTTVLVTTALSVTPTAINVDGVAGGVATFTITGGIPSYTITRNNAAAWTAPVPATVTASGGTFTVTVPANTPAATVTYTIRDSVGTTVTATLTVGATTAFTVTPASQTIPTGAACPAVPVANTATYNIAGGMAPFTASTSHPANTSFTAPAAGNNITIPVGTTSFTIAYDVAVAADTTVTLTITDSTGVTKTVTLLIDCP